MRRSIFAVTLWILNLTSTSFANENDSLWNIYLNKNNDDTTRIEALHDFAWSFRNTHPDSAIYYATIEAEFGNKKNIKSSVARAQNTMAVCYGYMGMVDSSIFYYNESYKFYSSVGNLKMMGVTKINMGATYGRSAQYAEAMNTFYEGMELSELAGDSVNYFTALMGIGVIYKKLGEYDEALEKYKVSLAKAKEFEYDEFQALAANNIANIYVEKLNYDSAMYYFRYALEIHEEMGDTRGVARCFSNIAGLYFNLSLPDSAYTYVTQAVKLRQELKDYGMISSDYVLLGQIHFNDNRIDSSIYYTQLALDYARKYDALKNQADALSGLASIYERKGDYKKAYFNHKEFIMLNDSLKKDENIKLLTQKDMKYQFDKEKEVDSLNHAQEMLILEAENEKNEALAKEEQRRNAIITISGGIVLLLVMGIAFVLYRSNKQKKKDNELISKQKQEVESQKSLVEEKNREIVDSITYAKRIQSAILPSPKLIQDALKESFVLYLPKDIVAGDFYWFEQVGNKVIFAVADCTGHGVPGALVSVVCHNALNRSVREFGLTQPADILNKTRELVIETFEASEENVKDGMDIALCSLDLQGLQDHGGLSKLQFAGANNGLYYISNNELTEIKPDKQPIGKFDNPKPFTNHTIECEVGDRFYLFSDGFADQFGGDKGKKLKYKPFKELILNGSAESMEKQEQKLISAFENWKGSFEQIDDVCIMGFQV